MPFFLYINFTVIKFIAYIYNDISLKTTRVLTKIMKQFYSILVLLYSFYNFYNRTRIHRRNLFIIDCPTHQQTGTTCYKKHTRQIMFMCPSLWWSLNFNNYFHTLDGFLPPTKKNLNVIQILHV